jgi:hypothetical protein
MRSASEKAAGVSALRNDGKQMELRAGAKKDFEANSRVRSFSSIDPQPNSLYFNFCTENFSWKHLFIR